MKFQTVKNQLICLLILILSTGLLQLSAADLEKRNFTPVQKTAPAEASSIVVEDNFKWHKIGTLWNRVTNFSYMGDDAYNDRTPSCDWPGGSGNSYLYRGTLWLSAFVDGTFHSTQGDDHEFAALDSVHFFTGQDKRSDQDTYTRYYDVVAPQASDHFPLGLEVQERTFAWKSSYADDFIIYEYIIKNVGIDTDGDSLPDTDQTLDDFYFTIRFDGDVSKLPDWDAEYRFSNQDDHAIANGISWDWIEQVPQMAGRDHGLTDEDIDSSMIIMFDGDNSAWPADDGSADDFGNPSIDGVLQTPGFLGIKILKSEPQLPKHSFHVCHIYNDPQSDQETWDRMISDPTFEEILTNPQSGLPFPNDYRGILTWGPLAEFPTGDSIKVYTALGVGCDPDSGGVNSLVELVKIMDVAQFIIDNDFQLSADALSPSAPAVEVVPQVSDGITTGMKIIWDSAQESHPNFHQYLTWKGTKNALGQIDWQPLGEGVYTLNDNTSWPPPASTNAGYYELSDTDITNGLVYYYSVQTATDSINDPIPFGVISSNIMDDNSFRVISPSNPPADNLNKVKVVPNPYIGSAKWNNPRPGDSSPWEHRIQFTNLPEDAVVKIFTLDGDFVDEITVSKTVIIGGEFDTSSSSVAEWDLMTRNDQEATPGMYLYVVDSPSKGQTIGKFVIIR